MVGSKRRCLNFSKRWLTFNLLLSQISPEGIESERCPSLGATRYQMQSVKKVAGQRQDLRILIIMGLVEMRGGVPVLTNAGVSAIV